MSDEKDLNRSRTRENAELEGEGIKDSLKGKGNVAKGRVKDAAGGLIGDPGLQIEGKVDQLKGKIQDTVGKAKRAVAEDDERNSR
jgi:uncharacterized protein YjbJ (UPF0337 family)